MSEKIVIVDDGTVPYSLKRKRLPEIEGYAAPTDAQTQAAVDAWMDEHSSSYIVPDNSLTQGKLVKGTLGFVTPEMYGANGDGATNDAEAIQNAIDNANGRTVYFPKGITYAISCEHAIKIPSYTKIILDGTIKAIAASRTGFEFFDFDISNTPGYTGIHDVVICGTGVFDANGQNLSDAFMTPFRVHHCSDIIISGITIKNVSKYHAIEIGGSQNVLIDSVKFLGVYENNVGAGTLESVQIEKITESGAGGALPYDGTMCRNITIRNCYFGESPEGGKMYEAVGSHEQVSDADSTMNSMHDGIIVEGCVIENTSWKPGITSAPLYDPSAAAIGFTYNVKNAIIRDNILLDVGVGIGIAFYQYCESISIERNVLKNAYGSGIVFHSNCSGITISENKIDSYGSYCEERQINNMAIGIYVGATCHEDLKVLNNFVKTITSYATLPIHLPGVAFGDFGKNQFQGNLLDVLSVLPSAQKDTFQNNFRRYNRDNSKILYDSSTGIMSGAIASLPDLRLFQRIEITINVGGASIETQTWTNDQIINFTAPPIRAVNMPNGGTTASVTIYELNTSINSTYDTITLGNNIYVQFTNGAATVAKYDPENPSNAFIKILKIRGYYGQNMIV